MKKEIREILENSSISKLILLFILGVIVIILWSKILFFDDSFQKKKSQANEKRKHKSVSVNKLRSDQDKKVKPDFNTLELYNSRVLTRTSPFLSGGQDKRAEFNYQNKEHKGDNNGKTKIIKKKVNFNFDLVGIVRKNQDSVIILKDHKKSYFLEEGNRIKGLIIKKITNKGIIINKKGRYYTLKLEQSSR